MKFAVSARTKRKINTDDRASIENGDDMNWAILCKEDKEQLDRIE